AEVVQREVALLQLLLLPLQLLLADLLLHRGDLVDQAHQVALADDPLGHALGTELLQLLQPLADADELDRDLGHLLDGQRGAAAPPRAAAYIWVGMAPWRPGASLTPLGLWAASWRVMASQTR